MSIEVLVYKQVNGPGHLYEVNGVYYPFIELDEDIATILSSVHNGYFTSDVGEDDWYLEGVNEPTLSEDCTHYESDPCAAYYV